MIFNQSYPFIQKLALYVGRTFFWCIFLISGLCFGQLFVADSTILTIEEGAFVFEETQENQQIVVFIGEGTTTTNFPTEGNFVLIDQNKSEGVEHKAMAHLKAAPKKAIEVAQAVKPKAEVEKFVRVRKASHHTFFSSNAHRAVGVVQVNSLKAKSLTAQWSVCFCDFISTTTSKIITKEDQQENQTNVSLFAPRGPPFFRIKCFSN